MLAVVLLVGYEELPDASRSLGRSLRISEGELGGTEDNGARASTSAPDLEREASEAKAAALEARARADAQRPQLSA